MNLQEARARGLAGAEQAANNCGPEWIESALISVRWFAKVKYRQWLPGVIEKWDKAEPGWTMEECRLWATAHDLPEAKSLRAWGQVTRMALAQGVITATGGYRSAISSNGSKKPLYRKA